MDDSNMDPGTSGRWVFVGEPIGVSTSGDIPEPSSIVWRAQCYQIAEIVFSWFDWNFPAGAKERDWKSRRHRKYYRVTTSCGQVFEIYHDRKSRNPAGQWVCSQRWEATAQNSEPDVH